MPKNNIILAGKVQNVQKKILYSHYRFTQLKESMWLRKKAKETTKDSTSDKWGYGWSKIRLIYKIVPKNNIKVLQSNEIVQKTEG